MALGDNALGYYKLEASGADSVGTIGTLSGTAPTYTTGKIGNGGLFASASNQYLESAAFVGPTSWGLNFWYNATTIPSSHTPVCRDTISGTGRVLNVSFAATQATLYGWNSSGTFYQTATTSHGMSTGTWYMWTALWDAPNSRMRLYLNASLFTNVAISGNAEDTSVALTVGANGAASRGDYTNAKIDEVYFRGSAFTDAEITELYAGGSPGAAQQFPFTTGRQNRMSLLMAA